MLVAMLGLQCGSSCPVFLSPAFEVIVIDSATGSAICDATVTANGANTYTLEPQTISTSIDAASCGYIEQGSVPSGSYTIAVTAAGYSPSSASATISQDGCGDEATQTLTLTVTPTSK